MILITPRWLYERDVTSDEASAKVIKVSRLVAQFLRAAGSSDIPRSDQSPHLAERSRLPMPQLFTGQPSTFNRTE